ncbi:MAG: tetratricopeptide repeat protein [Deltaproteobacteria bacterium]|nr:tetratricopeptide repeat protein [Deltaproteobacteria bacterium]
MGTIYSLYLDQYDEALQLYNVLIKDYPGSNFAQDALFNTGMVHYEKGTFGQAYQSFKSYLEKYPDGRHRQSAEVWVERNRRLYPNCLWLIRPSGYSSATKQPALP